MCAEGLVGVAGAASIVPEWGSVQVGADVKRAARLERRTRLYSSMKLPLCLSPRQIFPSQEKIAFAPLYDSCHAIIRPPGTKGQNKNKPEP